MSKTAHILCVSAGHGEGQFAPAIGFTTLKGAVADVIAGDLWVGPRPRLETLKPVQPVKDGLGILDAVVGMVGGVKETPKDLTDVLAGMMSMGQAMRGDAVPQTAYPAFIQIIPYYLFRNQGRYLRYLRTTTGGDARLHGKISVGIGGHIDLADVIGNAEGQIDLEATLSLAGKREADEEIGVAIDEQAFRYIGTIYATDTEVDRVHVGVVGVCDLTDVQAAAIVNNHEIGDHAFMTLADVKSEADADENKTLETWTRLVIESNPLA